MTDKKIAEKVDDTLSAKTHKMTDVEMINAISEIFMIGTSRLAYNEDDDELYDDWGKIPTGFSLRTRACVNSDISMPTLRELLIKDKEVSQKIKADEYYGDIFLQE